MKEQNSERIEIVNGVEPPEGNVHRLKFADSRTGCAIALNHLLVTSDGGSTWLDHYPVDLKDPYLAPQAVHPVDSAHWWLLSTYVSKEIRCFQSSDAARSWRENWRFLAELYNIIDWDLHFANPTHGWILIVERRRSRHHSTLCQTANGGKNWSRIPFHAPGEPQRLVFADAHRGWIPEVRADRDGTPRRTIVHATEDGGLTWNCISTVDRVARDFCLAPSGDLFMCGLAGMLKRSADSGRTWKALNSHTHMEIQTISFKGPVGLAAGDVRPNGLRLSIGFLLTRDGGSTWKKIPSLIPGSVEKVWLTAWDRGVINTAEGLYQFRILGLA